jgi:hypothetical protein
MLDRSTLRDALARRLASTPEARAAYLGGSDAFGRADELSDLDLVVVCEAGREAAIFEGVEAELAARGGIARMWRVPTPAWHGMEQAFYALREAAPEALVDLACGPLETIRPFLVPERHGQPVVLHDPQGLLTPQPFDRAAHEAKVRAHVEQLRARFELFQPFVTKELARGHPIDAMAYYQGMTLRPLVDMLRCVHCPDRYDYGMRYLEVDLPPQLAAEVRQLAYVSSPEELGRGGGAGAGTVQGGGGGVGGAGRSPERKLGKVGTAIHCT